MKTVFQIKTATLEVPYRQDLFGMHSIKIHRTFGEMVFNQCQMPAPTPRLEPLSLGGTLSLKPKQDHLAQVRATGLRYLAFLVDIPLFV